MKRGDRMKVPLKYVQKVGKRLYFRRVRRDADGVHTDRIPLPPVTSPDFSARYQECLGGPKAGQAPAESMAQLVSLYRASPAYRDLRAITKAGRDVFLRQIEREYGRKPYSQLTKGKIKTLRNAMADRPGAANNFLSTLSVLMALAVDLELITVNPCAGVDRLKLGEHLPWPESLIADRMDEAEPMLRLAIALMLYTGQRIGDVCAMRWSQIDGDVIEVKQSKTGKTVWIPIHRELRAELSRVPRKSVFILWNHQQGQMRPNVIRRRLGSGDFTPHGLRKNAVNALLEAGCSTAEVSAITGQSLPMVAHYARGVNTKRLAKSAVLKWESGTK